MYVLLFLTVVAILLIAGWFLMKRLDCFLEENHPEQESESQFGENTLRIGLSNPFVSDNVADILERYSQIYTDISARIFYGNEKDLIKEFAVHKLDVVFLPENMDLPIDMCYNVKKVFMSYTPVMMKYGGLPIEPIVDGTVVQKILYRKEPKASSANRFVECIQEEAAVSRL